MLLCFTRAHVASTLTTKTCHCRETEEYELAPRWKRYTFASGFAAVSCAVIAFGAIAPGRSVRIPEPLTLAPVADCLPLLRRIVTKMTLRRPLTAPTHPRFPPSALVTIHTPITRLPGLSPRIVELSKIQLLGPLASRPRPYHPRDQPTPSRASSTPGPLSRMLRPVKELLVAPASAKKNPKPWHGTGRLSHVPIHVAGDRLSMSLAIKRGEKGMPGDVTGAWCEDWEGLERAMLGVPEVDREGRW